MILAVFSNKITQSTQNSPIKSVSHRENQSTKIRARQATYRARFLALNSSCS
jgi:mRNA-degrading endonuclease RelE of RelBE toxin-antitoxin system